ncbi:hypothetical protein CsatB_023143 [Cannabis sativa]
MPLLRHVTPEEAIRLLSEVHDEFCGNHASMQSLSKKILSQSFTNFCANHGIIKSFSAVAHPQVNGQVEVVNKTLKDTLKKKLEDAKGNWSEELPEVLWSFRTTEKTATGQTPFAMTYGYEAMLPVELEPPSHRRLAYNQEVN